MTTMPRPCVITIGNFDGVHLGHRAILDAARQCAERHGADVDAMTFEPHPAKVLRPERVPPRLMSAAQRQDTLLAAGADRVTLLEPTRDLLGMSAEQFIRSLTERCDVRAIVEGPDFHFGKGAAGDVEALRGFGERFGFEMIIVDPVEIALHDMLLAPVRSSLIRWLVGYGRVADAARCLGGPFTLSAEIVEGDRRGRTIGFPTANFQISDLADAALPARGVYAAEATTQDGRTFQAAVNVGVKPTFTPPRPSIEAHLLDFEGDLYGQTLSLAFHHWVRDEQKFPNIEALSAQLGRDVKRVRQQFSEETRRERKSIG